MDMELSSLALGGEICLVGLCGEELLLDAKALQEFPARDSSGEHFPFCMEVHELGKG